MTSTEIWPLWDVVITTPRLELRYVREADAVELVEVAKRGIHDPAEMPFDEPWTDLPYPLFEQSVLQFLSRCVANLTAESWRIPFVAYLDDQCVGLQDVTGDQFPSLRTVNTGSWLGKEFQGRGLGQEMRAGVLQFAFANLGAQRAETCAFEDNTASIAVTTKLGYEPNGEVITNRRGEPNRDLRFAMTARQWQASPARDVDVTVTGVGDELLAQLGIAEA